MSTSANIITLAQHHGFDPGDLLVICGGRLNGRTMLIQAVHHLADALELSAYKSTRQLHIRRKALRRESRRG